MSSGKDVNAEKAVIAGVFKGGEDIYLDICDFVKPKTFTLEVNQLVWACVEEAYKDDVKSLDLPTILSASKKLGFSNIMERPENITYIRSLSEVPVAVSNVPQFAKHIRCLEISRLMYNQLESAQDKVLEYTGQEPIVGLIGQVEDVVFDFTSLIDTDEADAELMGKGVEDYVQYLIDNPIKQIGMPTGWDKYDEAIGGGLRPATLNVIAARPKVGKTLLSDNIGYNISKTGVPVLNLDTEMTKEDHLHRSLAMLSDVPINTIETGEFGGNPYMTQKVKSAAVNLKEANYHYKSIAGMPFENQLALMRRWLQKTVGLKPDGTAKECVIILDYLKLMDSKGISADMKEYQLLGFMMTSLHNFAVRYKVPFLIFMQLNRDGITKESSDAASGSDRIIWLCSNFSIFKFKSDEEVAEDNTGCNRKLVVVLTRHGPGMMFGDYINVSANTKCAQLKEHSTALEANRQNSEGELVDDSGEDPDIPFD